LNRALLILLAVAACTKPPAGPTLTGVMPDRGPSDRDVVVTITGTGLKPTLVTDFSRGSNSLLDTSVSARLGREALKNVQLNADGTIAATVPAGFTPGTYDLTVIAPGGATMTLSGAYRVLSPSEAGDLVASYRFDPIGPQQVGMPFSVTITALDSMGATVDGFSGEATLTDTTGTVVPNRIGPLAAGVWTGLVEVRAVGMDALTVSDDRGITGSSNVFTVGAGDGTRLAFTTPPRTAAAGACSGAVTVQRVDSTGTPSPATSAIAVTLTASPALGFQLFADTTCSMPVTPTLAVGQTDLTFYFQSTHAGAVQLAAAAPGHSGATQLETVSPLAPQKIVFLTPDPTLNSGTCSGDITLQARDSFDNPSPVSADTVVALSLMGPTLYAPGGCMGAPITSVTLTSASANASFSILGTTAGAYVLTATAPGLGMATLNVRVNPAGFPTQLQIVSAAQTIDVATCSGPLAVQTQDAAGNPVINPGPLDLMLAASPTMGFAFYGDMGCTTPVTVVTVGGTTSTGIVYFKGAQSGPVTVTASSGGLQSGAQTETLRAGAATSLAFVSKPQSITAGTCSGELRVGLIDSLGNPTTAAMPLTVTLAAGAPLFSDPFCMTPATTFGLMMGDASGRLYMKPTVARTETVTATSMGLMQISQDETVTPAAPAALVFMSAPQTVGIGACSSAAVVEVDDAFGNPSPLMASGTATLTAVPSTGFKFYSDPACTMAVGSVPVKATASFFFKSSSLGTVAMTVASAGLTSATQTATLVAGAPAKLAFTTPARTSVAGTCSQAVTVTVEDASGNPSPVPMATAIALSPAPAGLSFFSDATCMTSATGLNLAAGTSSGTVYVRATVAAAYVVTASSPGLTNVKQTETVTAAAADHLVFVTPARTVSAGACSAAVTVARQDPFGNAATGAGITVTLSASPAAAVAFYSDSACTMAVTQVAIATSQATFYFKGTTAQMVTVTAASAPLTQATQVETVSAAAAPTQLVFTTPALTVTAGACSAIASVQSRDSFNNVRAVASNTTVALTGATTFYSDAACTMAVTQVTLASGMDTVSFYFKANTTPSATVTATAAGLNPASQMETVNPAAPSVLVFVTAPQTLAAGACSAVATVEAHDAFGNISAPAAAQTVALSGSAGVSFFSNATCGTAAASVSLAAGMTQASFYFDGTTAGTATLTATVGTWTPAMQTATINAGPPTQLVFTTPQRTVAAGSCSAVMTVQARDAFNNPTNVAAATRVNLSSSNFLTMRFDSDVACATQVTFVTIAAGASTVSFYVHDTLTSAPTVTAAAGGLTSATQTVTVTAGPPSRLLFTTGPRSTAAGACSQVLTVQLLDQFFNVAPAPSALPLTLVAAPPAGFAFDTDAACTMATTTATVLAGQSTVSFYFRSTAAGSITVTVSGAGVGSVNQTETVNPGAVTSFAWATVPTPVALTVPFGVTVMAHDTYGNVATGFTGTATLSMAPLGTVSCTSGCTNATTTGTFVAGQWSGSLTITTQAAVGTGRTLTATQGALTGTSNAFNVSGPAARSPPIARFTVTPAVIMRNGSATLDASGSSDWQTTTSQLQVTWDPEGSTAGGLPWTPWTTTKTLSHTYGSGGVFRVHLAVKDSDGDIDYRAGWIRVIPPGDKFCMVNTNSDVDDGAQDCSSNLGTDGKLSFAEALRLANGTPQTETIYFSAPMTITSSGHYSITHDVDIYAQPGVIFAGKSFQIPMQNNVSIWGLEMSGQTETLLVSGTNAKLSLHDVYFHDMAGIRVTSGTVELDQSVMTACTGPCLEYASTNTGSLAVHYSELKQAPSQPAVLLSSCPAGTVLDMYSNLVSNMAYGVQSQCNAPTLIRENTFDRVGTGVAYSGGTTHVLVDNIFTNLTTTAATCGTATFTTRDHHQLFNNASNGCLNTDPNTLTSDPTYAFAPQGDYRLAFGSPAINTAVDTGLDVCLGFPANYEGSAPDRGGRESY
jgi:hypothetical protein